MNIHEYSLTVIIVFPK